MSVLADHNMLLQVPSPSCPIQIQKDDLLLFSRSPLRQPRHDLRRQIRRLITAILATTQRSTRQPVLKALTVILLATVLGTRAPLSKPLHLPLDFDLYYRRFEGLGVDVFCRFSHLFYKLFFAFDVEATSAFAVRTAETAISETDAVQTEAFAFRAAAAFLSTTFGFLFLFSSLSNAF